MCGVPGDTDGLLVCVHGVTGVLVNAQWKRCWET